MSGNKIARRSLHHLAVKLLALIILTISTYYTNASKSSLPCEVREVRGGFVGRPDPPSPCHLPGPNTPKGERKKLVNSMR